ncbi:MAG: response regulator [Burkholderiales bacterium]|nr:response regulator [Burkholderiales bacterium]
MQSFPFALRLLGFSEHEFDVFQVNFENEKDRQPNYFCLSDDSLQEPDIYLVNGEDIKALAQLSDINPGPARPALIVGKPKVDVPWPYVKKPLQWEHLFQHLGILVGARAESLSALTAAELVAVPDRRRRPRLDFDLTDQSHYLKMRRPPAQGGVLLIDRSDDFCVQLRELMARYQVAVDWNNTHDGSVQHVQKRATAVVMINTSLLHLDPYQLCQDVKKAANGKSIAVILLVGKNFDYDSERARAAGSDGLLDKPLQMNQVVLALKKFLPIVK